jgi:hypothetical protein
MFSRVQIRRTYLALRQMLMLLGIFHHVLVEIFQFSFCLVFNVWFGWLIQTPVAKRRNDGENPVSP